MIVTPDTEEDEPTNDDLRVIIHQIHKLRQLGDNQIVVEARTACFT